MCQMIVCLVDKNGRVFRKTGIHFYSKLAEIYGLDEKELLRFKFDLLTRTLVQKFNPDKIPFKVQEFHNKAAQVFFNRCAGTPELLLNFVREGNWDKSILLGLLTDEAQKEYANTCNGAWKEYDGIWDEATRRYNEARIQAQEEYERVHNEAEQKYIRNRREKHIKTHDDAIEKEYFKTSQRARKEISENLLESEKNIIKFSKNPWKNAKEFVVYYGKNYLKTPGIELKFGDE